jgi:DNA mismatch endonuclease (patch repair protein)
MPSRPCLRSASPSRSQRRSTRSLPMAERWRQPFAASETSRRKMVAQRRKDTEPELAIRRALHARGLRYFVHRRPLPGLRREADIVFPRARVAVFVDGCFWHGCPDHGSKRSGTNEWYWPEKIERNRARDADTTDRLAAAGWMSVRVWEHEPPELAAQRVRRILQVIRFGQLPNAIVLGSSES